FSGGVASALIRDWPSSLSIGPRPSGPRPNCHARPKKKPVPRYSPRDRSTPGRARVDRPQPRPGRSSPAVDHRGRQLVHLLIRVAVGDGGVLLALLGLAGLVVAADLGEAE